MTSGPSPGGWFRPVGLDLGPRRTTPTPTLIPPAARPVLARVVRTLVLLVLLGLVAIGLILALILHPIATIVVLVGAFVVGKIVRVAWRTTR